MFKEELLALSHPSNSKYFISKSLVFRLIKF